MGNDENLFGWLNSGGGSPAERAIRERDNEDRRRYGDRVDGPDPYAEQAAAWRRRYEVTLLC